MKIESMAVNRRGRVSVRWVGGLTSYNTPQHYAIGYIASDATTPGCYVEGVNYRIAGQALPDDHRKARRFAERAGIPYHDKVTFPTCDTREGAERLAIASGEPYSHIAYIGIHYCDDGTLTEHAWQAQA